MTTIIMTDVTCPYGKYTKFTERGRDRKILAEVDRRDGRYVVFGNRSELGSRTNKDAALRFAKDYIKGFLPDAVFKWNVMSERINYR